MQLAPNPRDAICNLLGYANELLRLGEKPLFDVKNTVLAVYEHELTSLEGATIPSQSQDWFKLDRLHHTLPPPVPDGYSEWLSGPLSRDPSERPRLRESKVVEVTAEEASELIEGGFTGLSDVIPDRGDLPKADVIQLRLRISKLAEFAAAFEAWVQGPWTDWATVERPRRQSVAVYNRLFEAQQRIEAMGDDTPIEAVLGVGMARWVHGETLLNAPIITSSVELSLSHSDGSITIRSREQPPQVVLSPFEQLELAGISKLQRETEAELERFYKDPDVGFSPHTPASFDTVLRMCASRLTGTAVYLPKDSEQAVSRKLPAPDSSLQIVGTWVLFVRQRSLNFVRDDIQRLGKKVGDTTSLEELPPAAAQMMGSAVAEEPRDAVIDLGNTELDIPAAPKTFGGPPQGSGSPRPEQSESVYFFPLPYNEKQIEIIQRLNEPETKGVVVQGPPGTGKTHTIVNIIAHYMATGKRILVSAKSAEALSAIQYKLPPEIRDLVISLIHSDRDGARKLEQAVDVLASQVKQIDLRAYSHRKCDLEQTLSDVRTSLADIDRRIAEYAASNLAAVPHRGELLIPMDLAARLEQERPQHTWLSDELDLSQRFEPQFQDLEVAEARRIRATLGSDIAYVSADLPGPDGLPETGQVVAAHASLSRDRSAQERAAAGDLLYVSFGPSARLEDARELHDWIVELDAWAGEAAEATKWLPELYSLVLGGRQRDKTVRDTLLTLCTEWSLLHSEAHGHFQHAIELPPLGLQEPAFDQALADCANGKKPFGLLSFGKAGTKAQLEAVLIDRMPPKTAEQWACVRDLRLWQNKAVRFAENWSRTASIIGWPDLPPDWGALRIELLRIGPFVQKLHELSSTGERSRRLLGALFPSGVDPERVIVKRECSAVREALAASIAAEGRTEAVEVCQKLDEWSSGPLPLHKAIARVREALGTEGATPRQVGEAWKEVLDETRRLHAQRDLREGLKSISTLIRMSGAPLWATALVSEPAAADDIWTPARWKSSWEWARAAGFLRSISDRKTQAALSERRRSLEDKQREVMAELIQVRTFIGLKQGITNPIAAALTKFAMQVARLGAGTGKAAERVRRAIREAALEASEAVPCWVLPEWRVAEQLPSELANFDLVIIDEASQSDVTSLATVLRGKKLLVVGDDKQVSPSAVGIEERTVIRLRETFLRGMHIANHLEPSTSLYDLAAMTLPGSVLMLQEHFRCVEPIIRFSSRFYPKNLIPLRIPTAEERLDPPLIDIYVPHGQKQGDRNSAEAEVIVDEIEKLVDDPACAQRSIGVISLLGDKQAKLVWDRLNARTGADKMQRHRIMCGNASTFQGQERDIIFLSMVASPGNAKAQTARMMEQRFNVAMSRARDRMYLVRSVAAAMLNPNDLKHAVIEHFRNPMGEVVRSQSHNLLDLADSDFERDFGRHLLDLGYHLTPQLPVGGYRIDFVIEGDGDRRLAVELDGDRYHGPDRGTEDHRRQRALERKGWGFWRCWGSHWLADRQGCLDDLLATLNRLGIGPRKGEMVSQIWTEHRTVGENEPADVVDASSTEPSGAYESKDSSSDGEPSAVTDQFEFERATAAAKEYDEVVEPGDTVVVRFADDNRKRRFKLSRDAHDPDGGIVNIRQPIGVALLGSGPEEEVDLHVGGKDRRIVIESITKAA